MRFTKVLLRLLAPLIFLATPVFAVTPLPGAIFTTDNTCTGVNINIFASKSDVYLDGGPAHSGAAGLPDGSYFVQVTEPAGTALGTSVGSGSPQPVHVTSGEFDQCYQLSSILIKTSDSTQGYDSTSNPGGEYKVWVSMDPTFPNNASKTDNFKVKENPNPTPSPTPVPQATLNVNKFYDANANGINDDSQPITGWQVRIQDDIDIFRDTPVIIILDPDTYTVTESTPIETNWVHTTTNPVGVTLNNGNNKIVEFGNVCLGPGGGLTLGFWSNKNGQATMTSGGMTSELAFLSGLNLRSANGSNFDPTTYTQFRTWILGANATNMAYMLSAQLAAMELNVNNGKVSGSALVYAPGLLPFAPITGLNSLGFISINALMTAANTELGTHSTAVAGNSWRAYQEALKNALDKANDNTTFVQSNPCTFSF